MDYATISLSAERGAAILTLARPERRNAISLQMMEEIVQVCARIDADDGVRTLIVTGGQEFFSSGADLTEALEVTTVAAGAKFFGGLRQVNRALETLRKPVIAAIEGFCMTGGCELALACDLRIAGAGATFAITSSRIGTIAGAGGTQRLPRIVGIANALQMLLSADPIDADEALRIGLINRKTDCGAALSAALSVADTFVARAPLSLAFTKQAVRQGIQMDLGSGLDLEMALVSSIYGTADKQEGVAAFLEKRKPKFVGR
jgi:enoyl-CoA hydratase/carnithine racemase